MSTIVLQTIRYSGYMSTIVLQTIRYSSYMSTKVLQTIRYSGYIELCEHMVGSWPDWILRSGIWVHNTVTSCQCCGPGMIYYGSSYEFQKFRIRVLPMLFIPDPGKNSESYRIRIHNTPAACGAGVLVMVKRWWAWSWCWPRMPGSSPLRSNQ